MSKYAGIDISYCQPTVDYAAVKNGAILGSKIKFCMVRIGYGTKLDTHFLARKGMSQAELAKLTGIRPSTICDLCNNNTDFPKIDHLNRILKALNCSLNDVLSDEK